MHKLPFDVAAADSVVFLNSGQFRGIAAGMAEHGFATFELNGNDISTKQQLIVALAKAMSFPGYFRKNWDSVEECLVDLSWIPSSSYIILFANADKFAQARPAEFRTFIEIIRATAGSHRSRKVMFMLVLENDHVEALARPNQRG